MEFFPRLLKKNIAEGPTMPQQPKGNIFAAVRSLSGYSKLIILLGVILIASLWLFVWHQINYEYDKALANASQETMNLAIAYEENVRRIIADADKDLLSIKQAYERDGLSSSVIAASMQNWTNDPARNQVAIFDERGFLLYSFIKNRPGTNSSDRSFFQIHRDLAADTLYIGQTIQARGLLGQSTIPLSRRIDKPDGSFGGIVYIGLKTDYFLEFYKKMNLGENRQVALYGTDGFNRARRVGDDMTSGLDSRGIPLMQKIQIDPLGTYISKNALDGITRIVSYHVMAEYPLIVVVAQSTEVALTGYTERKQGYILGVSLTSLFILGFCCLLILWLEKQRTINARLEVMVNERTQQVQAQNEELQAKEEELTEVNRKLVESGAVVQAERERLSSLINSISDQVWFADTKKQITKADTPHKRTPGTVAPVFSVLLKRMPKYG